MHIIRSEFSVKGVIMCVYLAQCLDRQEHDKISVEW